PPLDDSVPVNPASARSIGAAMPSPLDDSARPGAADPLAAPTPLALPPTAGASRQAHDRGLLPAANCAATAHSLHIAATAPAAASLYLEHKPRRVPTAPVSAPPTTSRPRRCDASSATADVLEMKSSATRDETGAPKPDRTAPPPPLASNPSHGLAHPRQSADSDPGFVTAPLPTHRLPETADPRSTRIASA